MSLLTTFLDARTRLLGALGVVTLPALMAAALLGPWSPTALERADRLAVQDQVDSALSAYEAVAQYHPMESTRLAAVERGATVLALSGQDPERAVEWLRDFTREHANHPQRAELLARMAAVLERDVGNAERAARVYARAAEADPAHALASTWRLNEVELLVESEQLGRAFQALQQLAQDDPESAPAAWSRMARLRLGSGDSGGAARLYERVLDHTPEDSPEAAIARLGTSICLEDLGRFDEALAELDELTDTLSPAVIARRQSRADSRFGDPDTP